jgi:hypothetical protein
MEDSDPEVGPGVKSAEVAVSTTSVGEVVSASSRRMLN